MATPAVGNIKVNRKTPSSPQNIVATELTSAVASDAADSERNDLITAHEEISRLAYSYWEARGCEGGSADEDWYRAEGELKAGLANQPNRPTLSDASLQETA